MEYGDKIIKNLTPHIKHYYNITYTLSTMLINNNHLDAAKELLTAALSNITIDDQVNAKDIGWYQYNLGVVYYKTGQLELAIKYYNSAIDRLPEEEEIIYNLWTIYGYYSDSKNIENLLNKMPEGGLKALLKLGRYLNNITNEKLETMNSKNLLPYHVQRFEFYKYTAKYNALSDERKIAQKIRLAKDLNTITKKTDINNTDELLVLSVAIYTKQLDIARNILNNIPNNDIAIYKSLNLSTLAAFPDPNSIIYNASTLKKEEITEVLNAASISLMAEDAKEFVSKNAQKVLQNVEKVLEDAPQNEETLEIGINAANQAMHRHTTIKVYH
ncbi:tetratricopeptide repeat protein [Rickettsia gravesii]|uniref:tetratricopeptide repeat protein n=1 Tax=Rickettsia gravesii TaxID=354585 RepID=UPI0003617A0E|nr:tetratricopeptide repeat protein [Rickettsia gravesii]